MAPREPLRPQLDFPQLTADLIEQFNLKGQVGLLDFLDQVRPVIIIGTRGDGLPVTVTAQSFTTAQVFSGSVLNAVAGTVVADTGQLPEGTYDIKVGFSNTMDAGGTGIFTLEHRNAANAANLASWPYVWRTGNQYADNWDYAMEFATDERLRWLITDTQAVGGRTTGWIMAAIRAVP